MKIWSVVLCQGKTALGTFQLSFNFLSRGMFFKATGIRFFKEVEEGSALAISAFPPVSLLVCGDYHPSLAILHCLPKRQFATHTQVSQSTHSHSRTVVHATANSAKRLYMQVMQQRKSNTAKLKRCSK